MRNLLRAIFGSTIFLEEINELSDLRDRNKELNTENKLLIEKVSELLSENKKLNKKDIELESRVGRSCCSGDFCELTDRVTFITEFKPGISDNVAVYVPDLAGGKVIKQEANKCVKINKEGEVEEGYTRKRCDKGFNYKLIREK